MQAVQTNFSALYLKNRNRQWLFDDKSHFTLNYISINGNDIFYSTCGILVLESFILEKGNVINQNIYTDKCSESRLFPFIKIYHSDNKQ